LGPSSGRGNEWLFAFFNLKSFKDVSTALVSIKQGFRNFMWKMFPKPADIVIFKIQLFKLITSKILFTIPDLNLNPN
jgi:hypothetical protein